MVLYVHDFENIDCLRGDYAIILLTPENVNSAYTLLDKESLQVLKRLQHLGVIAFGATNNEGKVVGSTRFFPNRNSQPKFVEGIFVPGKCAHFMGTSVHKDYRRKGIASDLLRCALLHAKAMQLEVAFIPTGVDNYAARKLFESLGFRPTLEYRMLTVPIIHCRKQEILPSLEFRLLGIPIRYYKKRIYFPRIENVYRDAKKAVFS